jgi:hypothetical protein
MRRLVAGSWVGELGWEIMSWQGYLRKLAVEYEEVIVCAPTGHECFYSDFSHQYIAYDHNGMRDCWWTRKGTADHSAINAQLDALGGTRVTPARIPIEEQKFIQFGDTARGEMTDVLVHARASFGTRPGHTWPVEHWGSVLEALSRAGLRVAAIGSLDGAMCPVGALDWRGMAMQKLMDTMAATRLVVGPSSGPMHLASLCGTPHLVWTDRVWYSAIRANNRKRYETLWNPLSTPCRILDTQGWVPLPSTVLEEILYCLERFRRN